MKKSLWPIGILSIILVVVSCSTPDIGGADDVAGGSTEPSEDYLVSMDEAQKRVEDFILDIDNVTRSGDVRRVGNAFSIGGFGATRTEGAEDAPLYYVFNFEDEEGFAIASGDDRTPPIFCVTENGEFGEGLVENPGAAMLLASIDCNYRVAVGLPIFDADGNAIEAGSPNYPDVQPFGGDTPPLTDWTINWDTGGLVVPRRVEYPWEFTRSIGRMFGCQWGQGSPYNNMAPIIDGVRCPAGCGAVAVAQILYHYGYPKQIGNVPLNWNLIRRHINTDTAPYQGAHSMIAAMFRELNSANYLQADYGADGTSTSMDIIHVALNKIGYSCSGPKDYNSFDARDCIRNGRPLLVAGFCYRIPKYVLGIEVGYNYRKGHFWICDQLKQYQRRIEWYSQDRLIKTDTEQAYYVHCNWGWDGSFDGYYLLSEFKPGSFSDFPDGENVTRSSEEGEEGYYQYNLKMWNNISR